MKEGLHLTPGLISSGVFVFQMDDNIPHYIIADSVRLKQILVNLLSNAVKFTSFGEIRLDIDEISSSNKKSTIKFSVKDTGIGIKVDNNKKIFYWLIFKVIKIKKNPQLFFYNPNIIME